MADWETEARPIPAELTPEFHGQSFPKPLTRFATWAEQLEVATHDQLLAMAKTVL
jgi:hypothetical protein